MRLRSGRHEGETVEYVLLKYSDWAYWMMKKYPKCILSDVFRQLVGRFNRKPFTVRCRSCDRIATRATAYQGTGSVLRFWCDDHEPAEQNRLTTIETFPDAMCHVDLTCTAPMKEKRNIIRALARGKGLPERLNELQALQFFA